MSLVHHSVTSPRSNVSIDLWQLDLLSAYPHWNFYSVMFRIGNIEFKNFAVIQISKHYRHSWHIKPFRPCSVDSLDGGATDVPILGPMEIKNYIIILFFIILPTCRFQNFLRIENRTIISRDTANFVQEGQFLLNCYKNKHSKMFVYFFFLPTYRLKIMEIGKKFLFLWFFVILSTDRLYQKGSRKIRHPMNQPSMA